jgi:hypothetical protein
MARRLSDICAGRRYGLGIRSVALIIAEPLAA